MQAMILAAGFGTRLLPYTERRPKPLFPILNKPLLQCTIEMLRRYGADKIIINCHHLREQIVKAVAGNDDIIIQQEDTILGTGGGVRRALQYLADEPLLLTNGDIYHAVDLAALYQHHLDSGFPVTLAMHNYPRFNTVDVQEDKVCGFSTGSEKVPKRAFTGIHVINPEVLQRVADQGYSCIIELYRTLLQEKRTIGIYDTGNCFWTDMGTVEDYLALNRDILAQKVYCSPELGTLQGRIHRGKNVSVDPAARLDGWCVLGDNVRVEQGARLSDVVVWDNVLVPEGAEYSNTIVAG